jgi:RNA polymerase sigma factor (sigma-70 family)
LNLKKLIRQCQQQDRKAQSQIYQLYAGKLFGLCLKYSKNYQEAQDNLQDSFITIFKKIEAFEFKGSFEGWLKRIVVNTALQKYREKNVLSLVTDNPSENEEEVLIEQEDISLDYLLSTIQELPNQYRLVFNLYVLDGYSHKEIADMLTISQGTSKSNLSRARLILKRKIDVSELKKNKVSEL